MLTWCSNTTAKECLCFDADEKYNNTRNSVKERFFQSLFVTLSQDNQFKANLDKVILLQELLLDCGIKTTLQDILPG
jgi:hypothetical protein